MDARGRLLLVMCAGPLTMSQRVLIAVLALAGCGRDVPSMGESERRDSAGITIVVSEPAGAVARWTIADEPALIIGTVNGPEAQQLHLVRDPLRLEGGSVLLGNAGTHEIRLYRADGSLVWSTGREGAGPGEFRAITWVRRYRGDSIATYDAQLDRVTILGPVGGVGRTVRFRPQVAAGVGGGFGVRSTGDAPSRARPVDVFIDGTFLARLAEVSAAPGDTTALRRDPVPYARFDAEGRLLAVLDTLPDDEIFIWAEGGSRAVRPRAFGRTTAVTARGERLYVADNSAFHVAVLDMAGRLLRISRATFEREALSAAARDAWTREELAGVEGSFLRAAWEGPIRAMPFPDSVPHHGALALGSDGSVWLARWALAGEPTEWVVFGPDGIIAATVVTPGGFELAQVGEDFVLGVQRDALDVERVVLYPLNR